MPEPLDGLVAYAKPLSGLGLANSQPLGPTILLAGTGVTTVGLVWEHIARTRGSEFKPSVGIKWLANHSANFFSLVGSFLGKISSYLYHMDLKGLIYIGSVILLLLLYVLGSGVHGAKIGGSVCPYLLCQKLF